MKTPELTIRQTDEVEDLGGLPCRAWSGVSPDGIQCKVWIASFFFDDKQQGPAVERFIEQIRIPVEAKAHEETTRDLAVSMLKGIVELHRSGCNDPNCAMVGELLAVLAAEIGASPLDLLAFSLLLPMIQLKQRMQSKPPAQGEDR